MRCSKRPVGSVCGVRLHFAFRRYSLAFRTPVRTAHGLWPTREGLLVRITDADGNEGWGEVAPIPAFGTETVDAASEACLALGEWVHPRLLDAVPRSLPCLRQALVMAQSELEAKVSPRAGAEASAATPSRALPVAALLPAGKAALEKVGPLLEAGFRAFKWKVGVGDLSDELGVLDDLLARLPAGARLRTDANGAWDRRRAERWLECCAERPIEFVEQPIAPDARGAEDLLLGLAADYPVPIALDESVATVEQITHWLGIGWPGVFVLKPLLLSDPRAALAALRARRAPVVFSSALETAVGARTALRLAFEEAPADGARALGFGVWPLFQDGRADGPWLAPFVRMEDVERLDPMTVWNALT